MSKNHYTPVQVHLDIRDRCYNLTAEKPGLWSWIVNVVGDILELSDKKS